MEIDHVFVFVDALDAAAERLAARGLRESYRRQHPGQGTRNACFAFDNLFVELLVLDDVAAARGPATERTLLFERSRWRETEACPFGIAWRGAAPSIDTWGYRPTYLPDGMVIDVAVASDDARQPMLFTFSGLAPPSSWPAERGTRLQRAAGFAEAGVMRLELPRTVAPSDALRAIASDCAVDLRVSRDGRYALYVETRHEQTGVVERFCLPDDVIGG